MSVICYGEMSAVISGVRVIAELKFQSSTSAPKQTYYGALDYFNHEFLLQAYPIANSEHKEDLLNKQRTVNYDYPYPVTDPPTHGSLFIYVVVLTISFLDYLQTQRPNQRIAIIWDGAGPDRSQEVKDYLQSLNTGRAPSSSWQLTCLRFAPNAPEQNPVEDVWLQAKRFLREFYHLCDSFSLVKLLFELVTHGQTFNFPKLFEYAVFPQTT